MGRMGTADQIIVHPEEDGLPVLATDGTFGRSKDHLATLTSLTFVAHEGEQTTDTVNTFRSLVVCQSSAQARFASDNGANRPQ
jgi:hypothetical protein